MKTCCLALTLLITVIHATAQPTWQAYFITDDAPFTTTCEGNDPIDNHESAYVYLDLDNDGPDTTDSPPWCIMDSYMWCIPEDPWFSYRNFTLDAAGTLHSPLFEGWGNINPPNDDLHLYLRIFIGADEDTCYTSPVVTVPGNAGIVTAVFARSQWSCAEADVSPPTCLGSPSFLEIVIPDDPRVYCVGICDGGGTELIVGLSVADTFRPPAIQITIGCDSACEPAANFWLNASAWYLLFVYSHAWWHTGVIGGDVGCVTIELLDSIPCARLDTLTITEVGSGTEIRWNTTRESSLDSFYLWQTLPSPLHIQVAGVAAIGGPSGAEYNVIHPPAFAHGNSIAYLLTMVDSAGQQYGAAYVEHRRSLSAGEPDPAASDLALTAHPNPFNAATTLIFSVPTAMQSKLVVHDVLGRAVKVIHDGMLENGERRFTFDASGLPSGIYFARVQAGEFVKTQKLLLLK